MGRRNRPTSIDHQRSPLLRAELINTAARLIVDEGVTDFHLAKRKALKILGLPESFPMPGNEEIESALREYQSLFVSDEQQEHLLFLRETALDLMHLLADFRPYLTGSVLDGTAGAYSSIDLLLFADSAKEVEIFLLNQGLAFHHGTPRDDRVEAVFVLDDESGITANLIVFGVDQERVSLKFRDGRTRGRARRDVLQAMLEPAASTTP